MLPGDRPLPGVLGVSTNVGELPVGEYPMGVLDASMKAVSAPGRGPLPTERAVHFYGSKRAPG